jgi:uncharacterized SAM-binding protein YcdF (DUF218 family)
LEAAAKRPGQEYHDDALAQNNLAYRLRYHALRSREMGLCMSWFLVNLFSQLLLPPLSLLLLAGAGLWVSRSRPAVARRLLAVSVILLWLAATPYVAEGALRWLEGTPVALNTRQPPVGAIVVLGAGQYFAAPEYGGNTVSRSGLERLRYAARLQRETGLPLLVTGGSPEGDYESEAMRMKTVLEQDFQVPVRWVEGASDNTLENARFSRPLLQAEGIQRIYLITHAWHMPRAAEVFRRMGFEVVPAPTAFTTRYRTSLLTFIPSGEAMHHSHLFAHEVIGMAWYRLKLALGEFTRGDNES